MPKTDSQGQRARRLTYALTRILGKPQEQLAAELRVSFTTVNAWANGRRKPRGRYLEALEAALRAATRGPATEAQRVRAVLAQLHVLYGSPRLGNVRDPLDELFYILLSLKTSHRTYGDTYKRFRARFYPWSRLLRVRAEEVEAYIRRGGLGSLKARAFVDIAMQLKRDFRRVTLTPLRRWDARRVEEYLMSLPGVGVKTARCVMMYALRADVVPVDTHTYRVGVRLGIIPTSKNPNAAHEAFDRVTPPKLAYDLHTNFVAHGRDLCLDPVPKCEPCPVKHLCRDGLTGRTHRTTAARANGRNRPALLPASTLRDGRPRAVDIYSGCGGLSLGLELGGFAVAYAVDWDRAACETHAKNFPEAVVERQDVRGVSGRRITRAAGGPIALVTGGPNCQGVSERGLRTPDDPRNFMFPEFVRLVSELRPAAFLMENVPGLAHRHNFTLLRTIYAAFERLGYRCSGDVLLAADYGVPQLRYRFFMVGTIADIDLTFPAPTHAPKPTSDLLVQPQVTVWDAIGDLPSIEASRQADEPIRYASEPQTAYQRAMREGVGDAIMNHVCSATDDINLRRAKFVPEGGNWKDIPGELLPDRFFACRMTDHSTTYARLRRDMPAFTITALFGNITAGAFTHPLDNRALSIREGARLQSFPDRFTFCGPRNLQYKQIGNAVPPLLGAAVARHLYELLAGRVPFGIRPRLTPALLNDPRGADALPILTPRFKELFGQATRWPKGWGPEAAERAERLTANYTLRPEFLPAHVTKRRRKVSS